MSDSTIRDSSSAVCVLGMHRSGTSTMSGILNLLGFHIGRQSVLMRPDEFNAKGYWEHQLLTDLNDEILSRLGGNWHTPPPFPPGWEKAPELEDLRQRARVLIQEEFGSVKCWSWKDPRNCLLLPFWQPLLPPMRYVISLRNPVDVAKSLMRRDSLTFNKCVELWLTHVKSALVYSENHPRLIVCYEELLAAPDAELRRIGNFLGKTELVQLESTRQAVREFVDKELCHNQAQLLDVVHEPRLPYEEKSLYTILQLIGNLLKPGDGGKASDQHLNQVLSRLGESAWDARVGFKAKVAELAVSYDNQAELERQRAELERQLRVLHGENRRLNEVVRSAEQWQTFWFRRIFNRWHPPSTSREKIGFMKKLERSIRKRRKRFFNNILKPKHQSKSEPDLLVQKPASGAASLVQEPAVAIYFNTHGNYFFQEMAQLLQVGMVRSGYRCLLRTEQDGFSEEANAHLVVAPHEFFILGGGPACLPEVVPERLFLLNTEQRQTQWFQTAMPTFSRARHVFDMDLATSQELKRLGYSASHLQLGYVEDFYLYNRHALLPITPETEALGPTVTGWIDADCPLAERPIDLSFVGEANFRRCTFFARLAPCLEKFQCHLRLMPQGQGPWRAEGLRNNRRPQLTVGISQRSKIVLNVHRDDQHYFEWHRIVMMGIWQRALVITETVTDASPFVPGKDFVQSSLEEMPQAIEYYLRDPRGVQEAEAIRMTGFKKLSGQLQLSKILKDVWQPFQHLTKLRE